MKTAAFNWQQLLGLLQRGRVCGWFGEEEEEEEEAGEGVESWVAPLHGPVGGHRSEFLAGCLTGTCGATCSAPSQEGRLKIPTGGPSPLGLPTSCQSWGGGAMLKGKSGLLQAICYGSPRGQT